MRNKKIFLLGMLALALVFITMASLAGCKTEPDEHDPQLVGIWYTHPQDSEGRQFWCNFLADGRVLQEDGTSFSRWKTSGGVITFFGGSEGSYPYHVSSVGSVIYVAFEGHGDYYR